MEKDPFINLYEDLMEMKHRRAGTKIFQKGLEKMQEDVMRAGEEIDRFVRQTVREFDSDFGRDPAFDRKYFLMRLKWISEILIGLPRKRFFDLTLAHDKFDDVHRSFRSSISDRHERWAEAFKYILYNLERYRSKKRSAYEGWEPTIPPPVLPLFFPIGQQA